LDYHTVSSDYLDDDFGYKRYDTKRTDLGELLYQLKYRSNQAVVDELVEAAATFIESWQPGADVLVPVPASRPRATQPVVLLGEKLAARLNLLFAPDWVRRVREVPELKNVQ